MFFKIISKLNSKKNFPYYICTPLVYGIGNASEHILHAACAAYPKTFPKTHNLVVSDVVACNIRIRNIVKYALYM